MKIIVLISKQALERFKNDLFVNNNKNQYIQEINMLKTSEGNRPTEIIGKFLVSPRGNKKIRIAWHFAIDTKTDTKIIYVDDMLYHISDKFYVDKWNEKVRAGKINLSSYSGYTPWAGF